MMTTVLVMVPDVTLAMATSQYVVEGPNDPAARSLNRTAGT